MSTTLAYRRHDRFGPVRTPGGALRDCRKVLKLTQREFAAYIRVSLRTLSRWEFDDHHPLPAERERVMTYLTNVPAPLVRTLAYAWGLPVATDPTEAEARTARIDDALERTLLASSEAADVSPRRLREGIVRMLGEIERLTIGLAVARERLEVRGKRTSA